MSSPSNLLGPEEDADKLAATRMKELADIISDFQKSIESTMALPDKYFSPVLDDYSCYPIMVQLPNPVKSITIKLQFDDMIKPEVFIPEQLRTESVAVFDKFGIQDRHYIVILKIKDTNIEYENFLEQVQALGIDGIRLGVRGSDDLIFETYWVKKKNDVNLLRLSYPESFISCNTAAQLKKKHQNV